jgi:hypothetical protein
MSSVIVRDIETVPDLKGFAAANGQEGKRDAHIRGALGNGFPKHTHHSIIYKPLRGRCWSDPK